MKKSLTLSVLFLAASAFAASSVTPPVNGNATLDGVQDYESTTSFSIGKTGTGAFTGNLTIADGGSLTVHDDRSTGATQYMMIVSSGSLTVKSGGSLIMSKSNSKDNNINVSVGGTMTIESGATVRAEKVVVYGTLNINQAIVRNTVNVAAPIITFVNPDANAIKVNLGVSQNMTWDIRDGANGFFTKAAGSDVVLTVSNTIFEGSSTQRTGHVVLQNFDNRSLYIEKVDGVSYALAEDFSTLDITTGTKAQRISFYTGSSSKLGDATRISELKLEEVMSGGNVVGYWLYDATLIPEPAEWAAIFGALALGLVIYRRRKQ